MDPITDVFATMHVAAVVNSRLEATAPWGLAHKAQEHAEHNSLDKKFSPFQLAHFAMVARGNCWLSVPDDGDPIPLTGGDCFLVAPGISYALRDDPRTPTRSFCSAVPTDGSNVIRYGGGGAPTSIISGLLSFETPSLKLMMQLMPNLILIKTDQAQSLALRSTLQMLAAEMAESTPGSGVVANRLAEVLFIQTLRAHIACSSCQKGWLRAIFDAQLGAALKAIHENVHAPWTVESLAATANMSRSAFASRFKELLGQTPLQYVTEWRMQKAVQLLKSEDKKLAEVAQSVGYESDAAFSKAFKRSLGLSPGEYRRTGTQAGV